MIKRDQVFKMRQPKLISQCLTSLKTIFVRLERIKSMLMI